MNGMITLEIFRKFEAKYLPLRSEQIFYRKQSLGSPVKPEVKLW